LKLQNRFGSNFVQGWRSALDTASQLIARVGMCRILKFSTDSVFKKLNLTNIRHPFRRFSDINRMHSAIQIKSEVALLASNVRTKNILKHDRNRVQRIYFRMQLHYLLVVVVVSDVNVMSPAVIFAVN